MSNIYSTWFRMQIGQTGVLIASMTLQGASVDELERAIRYSEFVIRSAKEGTEEAMKNSQEFSTVLNIGDLKRKYLCN